MGHGDDFTASSTNRVKKGYQTLRFTYTFAFLRILITLRTNLKEKTRYKALFRNITNLFKQHNNTDRYNAVSHENFDNLILTFTTHCRSNGIFNAKDLPEVFHVILKGITLTYFLRNYKGKGLAIKAIYTIMRSRFHTHEYTITFKRQWDFLTFQVLINKNLKKPL